MIQLFFSLMIIINEQDDIRYDLMLLLIIGQEEKLFVRQARMIYNIDVRIETNNIHKQSNNNKIQTKKCERWGGDRHWC